MSLTRIYAVFIRQVFIFRHNPVRFFSIFVWIFLDIILWGFISKYLDSTGKSVFSFTTVFFGAIILWELLVRIQQGVMNAFFEDLWSQNFLNYFGSPLKMSEYLIGLVTTGLITSTISFLIAALSAAMLFGFNIFTIGFLLFPSWIILFIFGVALGFLASALVLRFGPSAEWFAWPIPFALQPFAGVFYPLSTLPAILQKIAGFIPLSNVFEGARYFIIHKSLPLNYAPLMIESFFLSLIYLALAYWFFNYIYRYVLKNGLIARFSAESA